VHRIGLSAVLVLAACNATGPRSAGFREAEAPIWSAAAFAPAAIIGTWRQVAGFAARPSGCTEGGVEVQPALDGFSIAGTLCLDGRTQTVDALASPAGPGRLAVEGQEDWWILWVDSGYRTLAVGTPSGRFGFVLDRGAIPPDRLQAASEVFDFNGYVPGALRAF
jgi:apolipoprotein D and lipocalin family protein